MLAGMSEGEEAIKLGEALALLRRERGLSQAEAGARIGMTSQGWGFYETGKRAGLFRPDMQRRLTGALDATPEDLMLLVDTKRDINPAGSTRKVRLNTTGLEARGRSFDDPTALERQYWRIDTDDMAPWAFSGVVLEYVPGQWPRRDQGCVIDMDDRTRTVRLYSGSDARDVVVTDAAGNISRIARNRIVSLSAVTARREEN